MNLNWQGKMNFHHPVVQTQHFIEHMNFNLHTYS